MGGREEGVARWNVLSTVTASTRNGSTRNVDKETELEGVEAEKEVGATNELSLVETDDR